MFDWCYKFVDLPQIPDDIIEQAYKSIESDDKDPKYWWWPQTDSETDMVNGERKKSVAFVQFNLPEPVISWFKDNVVLDDYTNITISKTTLGDHKGAHTDKTRDYVLIYLLETGGNPATVFYKEANQELIRDKKSRVHDYDLLEEVDRVSIPERTWCLLNSRILHGVEQITGHRVGFHIGFNHPFKLRNNTII